MKYFFIETMEKNILRIKSKCILLLIINYSDLKSNKFFCIVNHLFHINLYKIYHILTWNYNSQNTLFFFKLNIKNKSAGRIQIYTKLYYITLIAIWICKMTKRKYLVYLLRVNLFIVKHFYINECLIKNNFIEKFAMKLNSYILCSSFSCSYWRLFIIYLNERFYFLTFSCVNQFLQ